jgi:hypothetical protein
MVPAVMARSLFENATECRRVALRIFPNGEHMDTWLQPKYIHTLSTFLNQVEDKSLQAIANDVVVVE